jgi:hypothetical protein
MREKEQQDDVNVKFIQILDIIENKMDKETNSSRSISLKLHDKKRREERSVEMNLPHSPKSSFRKLHSSSSTCPMINHKRRTMVDTL